MTTTYRDIKNTTETVFRNGGENFGLTDKQGRAIGYRWTIFAYQYEFYPEDETAKYCFSVPADRPQQGFRVKTQATRDGHKYGALTADLYFADLADAVAAVQKRAADAKKRYARAK